MNHLSFTVRGRAMQGFGAAIVALSLSASAFAGDTVAGRKVELIVKDDSGLAPETTKRIAQELVVQEKVSVLAGFGLTPLALAAAPVATEAMKGMKWVSPRGPMSIDPATRQPIQNVYLREVKMVNGKPWNIEFETFENVKDPGNYSEVAKLGDRFWAVAQSDGGRQLSSKLPTPE